MKRVIVFVNGNLSDLSQAKKIISKEDCLIAVDGGVRHILKLGLVPRIILGDFDSTPLFIYKKLERSNIEWIRYPVKKDKTDFELAIDLTLKRKYQEIIIVGIFGDRLDHFLANILLLSKIQSENKSIKIKVIEGRQEIFVLNKKIVINGQIGDEVSIIPIKKLKGIVTDGLEFKLNNESLLFGSTRGISNVLTKNQAIITVDDGVALVVCRSLRK